MVSKTPLPKCSNRSLSSQRWMLFFAIATTFFPAIRALIVVLVVVVVVVCIFVNKKKLKWTFHLILISNPRFRILFTQTFFNFVLHLIFYHNNLQKFRKKNVSKNWDNQSEKKTVKGIINCFITIWKQIEEFSIDYF